MSLRREVPKANLRCTVGRFENCGPPRSGSGSARPETSKGPSCSEIEVIIRDFESGPGVFVFASFCPMRRSPRSRWGTERRQ
jgi:hypothetical protein